MAFYNEKGWWASRTVWTGLIGTIFAILSFLDLVPADLTQESVLETVLAVVGVLAVVFRVQATTTLSTGRSTSTQLNG